MKILAVDDDPLLLEMLQLMLPTAGFPDLTVALGSHEALDLLADPASDFDCFLIDIQMPEIDGVQLVGRIHAMPKFANCPKIMLTAMAEISYVNRAFSAGATDYLTKPFEFDDIKTRLTLAASRLRTIPESYTEQAHAETLMLPDIHFMMSPDVLANYLTSLGRLNLLMQEFYLVEIDGFAGISQQLTRLTEFDLIEEICHEFSECVQGGDTFFSYVDEGRFVFVFNGRGASVDEEFIYRLKLAFETACLAVLDPNNSENLSLSLSSVVKPSIFGDPRDDILTALLARLRKAKRHRLDVELQRMHG